MSLMIIHHRSIPHCGINGIDHKANGNRRSTAKHERYQEFANRGNDPLYRLGRRTIAPLISDFTRAVTYW